MEVAGSTGARGAVGMVGSAGAIGSKWRRWAGGIITVLVILFLVFDSVTKIIRVTPVVEACEKLGIRGDAVAGIGWVLFVCTVIYVIPRTAILGALLLTGYLGGAAAIHVVGASGAFPIAFAIGFGLLVWAGLVAREPRLVWLVLARIWPAKRVNSESVV